MRKFKKIMALTCATTMMFTSTAFAAGVDTELEGGGSSIVENDNSTVPHIDNIVLPTVGNNTFDFTIDPEGLLADYDPVNYAADQSVYFNATKTPAKLQMQVEAEQATYKFYVQEKQVDTGLTALLDVLRGLDAEGVAGLTTELDDFFVWVPDTAKAGEGKFEALTAATLEKYVKITYVTDAVNALALNVNGSDNFAGDEIWDGNIYTVGYSEITGEEAAAKYYSEPSGTPTIADGLYVGLEAGVEGSPADYASITAAELGSGTTKVEYVEAVMQQTGKTDKATIINKSTFDIGVVAEVAVKNATGLTFLDSSTIAGSDTTASMYMAITDGTNEASVKAATGKATAYYVIKGTGDEAWTYQVKKTVTDTEAGTGSHIYKQYLKAGITYKEANFEIKANANINTDAKAAWDAYVKTLTATTNPQAKPSLEVVFKFVEIEKAEAASETVDDATVNFAKFTGKDASVFKVAAADGPGATTKVGTGGWATYVAGAKAPTIATTTGLTYSKANGLTVTVDLGKGNLAATGIASVGFGLNENAIDSQMTYTFNAQTGELKLNGGFMVYAESGAERAIVVTFNDSPEPTKIALDVTVGN